MSIIEEVMSDATDVSMLKINGNDLINMLHVKSGPIIGKILNILLDKCLDNPELNTKESLLKISEELLHMNQNELDELNILAVSHKKQEIDEKIHEIRSKYKVR